MTKRYRAPKAKPGQLKTQWGKIEHSNPDLCYAWGDGCARADGRLMRSAFSSKHFPSSFDSSHEMMPSFLEELEARGYDITTFRFSISKKVLPL